jgi:two-component system OmpR family response regulator/two-component system response regulator QseB
MRVMIVEDDPLLGQGLLAGLRQAGFSAEWLRDGQPALDALRAERFAAVVLDLGLPRMSGLELLRHLRREKQTVPVLILTARDSPQDVISGLDSGADDYLVKPCDLGELAARLRALVRRAVGVTSSRFEHGELTLDQAARTVEYQGKPVELSPREFALLEQLLLNAGRALTRSRLEETLYPWGAEIESNALDVHIHHLRRKLAPELIRTVRGVGYLIPK